MTSDAATAPGTAVVPWVPPPLGVTEVVRRVTDLGLGFAGIVASGAVAALERFVPPDPPAAEPAVPSLVRQLPGALLGVGVAAQRQALTAAAAAERAGSRVVASLARTRAVGVPLHRAEREVARWHDRFNEEQLHTRARVTELVQQLAPEITRSVIAELPIDDVVGAVDLNTLLARVDVDDIIRRVDVDALITRVDVDAIVARVDIDQLMRSIDLGPLVQRVLDEADIGAIIRQSTGSVTGDVVDGVRVTSMRLDSFVARITDRVMLRRRERALEISADATDRRE